MCCFVAASLVCWMCAALLLQSVAARKAAPEASSTFLKMHRIYMMHPPHDASLYNVLSVSPNATVADIQRAYKRKCRQLHPDKQLQNNDQSLASLSSRGVSSNMSDEERQEQLQQVREAYEVLKEDSTRLPYHRFGLLDTNMAAFLLTGGTVGGNAAQRQHPSASAEQERLLQWMGYSSSFSAATAKTTTAHQQRVSLLAANLLERIRPLVEGAMDEATLADAVARECDLLKTRVPLGAQIIRCIGRAYRHAGQRFLRKHHRRASRSSSSSVMGVGALFGPLHHVGAELSDAMRDKMRNAKQVLTAAVASGRVVVTEKMAQRTSKNTNKQRSSLSAIDYHMDNRVLSRIDELIGEDDVHDLDSHLESTEQIKEAERQKAQATLLQSLQVEALWKITKIDLDRTVQEACDLILSGEYFFFPSHQAVRSSSGWRGQATGQQDGWVGSTGKVVHASIGRLRAAAALVMIGDIMVRRSKEGTAWME